MEVLRLENLSKYYTSQSSVVIGLTGINLSFSVGEFVAVTGESGSGKSTMAHVLGGILPYEGGELYVYGQPTSHYDATDWERYRRDMIGFISQSYGILAGNTVYENVESALILGGMDKKVAREKAIEVLREVDLEPYMTRRAGKLSSGQKQRLSIARALAKPSKILIADEPTGNLDRENSEKIIQLLKKASEDRLVILITHEFEEAKDVATRRVILADGVVVTDSHLRPTEEAEVGKLPTKAKTSKGSLAPYVARLTLKARPVLTATLCILLALMTVITFIFLGTFSTAIDDTNTKIYDTGAFYNGDPTRVVVMRPDGAKMTEEDYQAILSVRRAVRLERWGYVNDITYHYREGIDFIRDYQDVIVGDSFMDMEHKLTEVVYFKSTDMRFVQSVPTFDGTFLTEGVMPKGVYEIVSADPDYKVGDTVVIYIRDYNAWSRSAYLAIPFDVVGESSYGEGFYFSDAFCAAMCSAVNLSTIPKDVFSTTYTWRYLCLPYEEERFVGGGPTFIMPANYCLLPEDCHFSRVPTVNGQLTLDLPGDATMPLTISGWFTSYFKSMVLTSYEIFEKVTDFSAPNQVSLYIEDYAYTNRVIKALGKLGYLATSPFQTGATRDNVNLATERIITLCICLATFLLAGILQVILLRALFSSLYDHYRLLSNVGLTAKTAYLSLSLMLLLLTLLGELIGGGAVLALNLAGVSRVVDLVKYLDPWGVAALIGAHFVSVLFALWSVLRAMKKNIFYKEKIRMDIDFSLMEDAV
ncbi:MAG: ABC transporter ATP-binding protein [Clostridia bacterium]|nr:ABC transporter ATP-binding protein [Clostridia bacterium]